MDELIKENKTPALVVVFPDGNGPKIHDSQYINATKISQPSEDYIMEVTQEVEARYRISPDRSGRGIGGLSSGAYGAMNIGLHHNDYFSIILCHSGYFVNNEGVTEKLLISKEVDRKKNNPLDYISELELNPKTYIYMDTGKSDNKNYVLQNEEMDKALNEKQVEHVLNITDGWHDWNLWSKNIINSLIFLGKYISRQY